MNDVLTLIISNIGVAGLSSIVTMKATKKKAQAEAEITIYNSLHVAFNQYKEMTDLTIQRLELRLEKLELEYQTCRDELLKKIGNEKHS